MWCKRSSLVLNARLKVLSCVLNERKLCVIIIGSDGNVQSISRKALMRQHAEDYSQPLSVSQTQTTCAYKLIFTRPDIAVQCYLLIKRARPKPKLDTEHMVCFIHLFVVMRKCLSDDMTIRAALKARNVCTNKQKHILNSSCCFFSCKLNISVTLLVIWKFFFLGGCVFFFSAFGKPPRRVVYALTLWACICNFPERIYCDRFLQGEQARFRPQPSSQTSQFNRGASYRWSGSHKLYFF